MSLPEIVPKPNPVNINLVWIESTSILRFKSVRNLLCNKDYWLISFGTFCRYGIYAAIQALWAGPFLMYTIGISQVTTGNLLFCFGFFSGAGQIMYAHIKELMPLQNAGAAMAGINFYTIMGVAFFLHGLNF